MQFYGIDAMVRIVSHISLIYLSFWALQSLKIEHFFKSYRTSQIRLVMIFLSIALGFTVSTFVLELLALCRNLFIPLFP
ncbi:DUF1146 family protein [Enterococcus rivorum]|uniref:DUF1146 domain-containing protein n=1 Tax=Enterococcus rivorum TaxID=762845 RepID=A0A1E5KTL7_9ENTE|nr:DUF1146 family protein [Enterococcus rivorum]MBP2097905.1 putative integral membrane protein (TIGR02327 family) [Enterococcus rivorum]OEH81242.1 hypothetical protein BCR26_05175 [Enterococcus rivorum]